MESTMTRTNGRQPSMGQINKDDLKYAAQGQWLRIVTTLSKTRIAPEQLAGSHGPCPRCGGTDRFRALDDFHETGAVLCNQCFRERNGDGVATLQWLNGWSFTETLSNVADLIGYHATLPSASDASPRPTNTTHTTKAPPACSSGPITSDEAGWIRHICSMKNMPYDSAVRFGARRSEYSYRGSTYPTVRFPTYHPFSGEEALPFHIGKFVTDDGKCDLTKGRHERKSDNAGKSSGLFLAEGKLPEPGSTVVVVEGVKDAVAFDAMGYQAVGINGGKVSIDNAIAFRNCKVILVPDRDDQEKAEQQYKENAAILLKKQATSVRIAHLPAEWGTKADVRDILQKPDGEDLVRKAIAEAESFQAEDEKPERKEWRIYSSRELAQGDFELRYLIDGILTAKQPGILAGKRKTLKTSVLIDLALSIASGREFLGKFTVPKPAAVGVFSGESGEATIQETAHRVCREKEIELANLDRLHWCFEIPRLVDELDLQQLQEFITEKKLSLLILDPTYLMLPVGDGASNLFCVAEHLQPLSSLIRETGCGILLCHHARKNEADPFEPPELDSISWAGFQEWARQWLILSRREKYEPGTGEHRLWMSVGGSAGHGGLWGLDVNEGLIGDIGGRRWDLDIQPASEAIDNLQRRREEAKYERDARKAEVQIEKDRETVRSALVAYHVDGVTANQMKEREGGRPGRWLKALEAEVQNGTAVVTEEVRRGRTCQVFRPKA